MYEQYLSKNFGDQPTLPILFDYYLLIYLHICMKGIPGVPKIKENHNPATWMLEVTGSSMEARLGLDFANLYRDSHLFQ